MPMVEFSSHVTEYKRWVERYKKNYGSKPVSVELAYRAGFVMGRSLLRQEMDHSLIKAANDMYLQTKKTLNMLKEIRQNKP